MANAAQCRGCGSPSVTALRLEEMSFGSREPFDYLQCEACGSISIAAVPTDLARHYPATYYSFTTVHRPRFGQLARRMAIVTMLNMPVGLSDRLPARWSRWRGMRKASVRLSTRILDVGCGNGALLRTLEKSGFKDLNGVDKFIDHGSTQPHITITRGELADLDGPYQFILMSHSLEHMPDPRATLRDVARVLAPGGHALISLPVANRSWREIGADWLGLDPPRHLFIPTVTGMRRLIESVPALTLRDMWFDTTEFEFWGSQLARRRVPVSDRATGAATDPVKYFGPAQLATWRRQAREYNKRGEAGTASFLVQKA